MQCFYHRLNDVTLFAAQVAVLAGVGVEARHQDTRLFDAEFVLQLSIGAAQHGFQAWRRNGRRHTAQRQVGRGQSHPQAGSSEHHYHLLCGAFFRQVFGMAGKGYAGVIDHRLVYRGSDKRLEFAVKTAMDGSVERVQNVARIGGVRFASHHFCCQFDGFNADAACPWCASGLVLGEHGVALQLRSPRGQQPGVADQHQFGSEGYAFQLQTKVGTDAGRLAGGEGNPWYHCCCIEPLGKLY